MRRFLRWLSINTSRCPRLRPPCARPSPARRIVSISRPSPAPPGWRMAYRYAGPYGPEGFTDCTYDGYTNEANLTSLAAHLAQDHPVPIERHWNSSRNRVRAGLAQPDRMPMVHSLKGVPAPFAQVLWNLFVDVRQRGVDNYPDSQLAVNPWQNFVCYEQNVMDRTGAIGASLPGPAGCGRRRHAHLLPPVQRL